MAELDTFQPEKRTLGQLLSNTSPPIRVPDFQRDFSWADEQISEFWADLFAFGDVPLAKLSGKEYFLGAAVLVNNGTFHLLLDGQQRLATTTILLAVLRDKMGEFKKDAAQQIHDLYIAFENHLTGEKIFKIQLNVFDRDFFRDSIQSFPRLPGVKPTKKSHDLIQSAYKYFQARVAEGWDSAGGGKKGFDWAAKLTVVLTDHMALVAVVSNNEKSAASIFATLNDRGIGLSNVDLIRSVVLQYTHPTQREEILQCWDSALEACGTDIRAEKLIRMSWVSHNGDVKVRALYKHISEMLEKGEPPVDYSRNLRDDAILYRKFLDADTDDVELQDYWRGLRILKAQSAYSLLLAANHRLSSEEQKSLAKAAVSLAIRHNIVCDLDRAKFESTIYSAAKRVSDGEGIASALGELRALSPTSERFLESFGELKFSQNDHGIARYMLTALETKMASTEEVVIAGSDKVHVEHIYPQTPATGKAWAEHTRYVNRIGNLTLLDHGLNTGIKNADFETKKKLAYSKSQLTMTKALLSCDGDWLPALVDKRQAELGADADEIWPLALS